MNRHNTAAEAPSAAQPASIKVWDLAVRLFHWSLAIAFFTAFLSEEGESLHNNAGYVVIGLVLFRIVWGLVGGVHARFSDFVTGPRAVLSYLLDMSRGRARRYLGHNPAGGAMVVALLVMCLLTAVSGWASITPAFSNARWIEEFHDAVAHLTLILVFIHVAGVLLACWQHKENLVWAMITGGKPIHERDEEHPAKR